MISLKQINKAGVAVDVEVVADAVAGLRVAVNAVAVAPLILDVVAGAAVVFKGVAAVEGAESREPTPG